MITVTDTSKGWIDCYKLNCYIDPVGVWIW